MKCGDCNNAKYKGKFTGRCYNKFGLLSVIDEGAYVHPDKIACPNFDEGEIKVDCSMFRKKKLCSNCSVKNICESEDD